MEWMYDQLSIMGKLRESCDAIKQKNNYWLVGIKKYTCLCNKLGDMVWIFE